MLSSEVRCLIFFFASFLSHFYSFVLTILTLFSLHPFSAAQSQTQRRPTLPSLPFLSFLSFLFLLFFSFSSLLFPPSNPHSFTSFLCSSIISSFKSRMEQHGGLSSLLASLPFLPFLLGSGPTAHSLSSSPRFATFTLFARSLC